MKYKTTSHIPTEQYGYIEVELEGSPAEIVEAYKSFSEAWKRAPVKIEGASKVILTATTPEGVKDFRLEGERAEKFINIAKDLDLV
jgi:hypothetical protein